MELYYKNSKGTKITTVNHNREIRRKMTKTTGGESTIISPSSPKTATSTPVKGK